MNRYYLKTKKRLNTSRIKRVLQIRGISEEEFRLLLNRDEESFARLMAGKEDVTDSDFSVMDNLFSVKSKNPRKSVWLPILVEKAFLSMVNSEYTYIKFLSSNDSNETVNKQSGFLVSTSVRDMFFTDDEVQSAKEYWKKTGKVKEPREVTVVWAGADFEHSYNLFYYPSKGEFRITNIYSYKDRIKFPYRMNGYTGALWILTRRENRNKYESFIFSKEKEIKKIFDILGIEPSQTNQLIIYPDRLEIRDEIVEEEIQSVLNSLKSAIPTTQEMSALGRDIAKNVNGRKGIANRSDDQKLIDWIQAEYSLFRALEEKRFGHAIHQGFPSMKTFVILSNSVLNARKSRAGKSLENQLEAIFSEYGLAFDTQVKTENKKRSDFVFPSAEAYHNPDFPEDRLIVLSAKTTCKDRWRQILNEANRVRNGTKYLFTLQQGISAEQLKEMEEEGVQLIVPEEYHDAYPIDWRPKIWSLEEFIRFVKERQNSDN